MHLATCHISSHVFTRFPPQFGPKITMKLHLEKVKLGWNSEENNY